MTNAQAALIAATSSFSGNYAEKLPLILKRADDYLEWLESKQTEAGPGLQIKEPDTIGTTGRSVADMLRLRGV